jgi:3-phosphoshikimate 1-carboxyvinyltransferase
VTYPDKLEIIPLEKPPHATVRVPGSKSITNRALVLAALSRTVDHCELHGALRSEDTEVMIEALRKLGFAMETDWDRSVVRLSRPHTDRIVPAEEADLFVGNSGTTMRFLTALVSLGHGRYRLDGVPRMRERPIEDLLVALRHLGVLAFSTTRNGCPPVIVETKGLDGGSVAIDGNVSSQFLSGLLMAAPLAAEPLTVQIKGQIVSWPYVLMTAEIMEQFGARVDAMRDSQFVIPAPQRFGRLSFVIEPDASAASYFFGAAAITEGCVNVPDIGICKTSAKFVGTDYLQGDTRFVFALENMGCETAEQTEGMAVRGNRLRGINIDMNHISDTVMTLAAVACFAEGPTTIRNVAHIRHKETDRLAALANELRKVGVEVVEFKDGLTITPRSLHGAEIETYNDHRMAMSMALIGLKVPGIVIKNPGCVAKTYPGFWDDLEKLRVAN